MSCQHDTDAAGNCRYGCGYNSEVAREAAIARGEDVYGHVPELPATDVRCCANATCGKPLQRKAGEPPSAYAKRIYCDRQCYADARLKPIDHGTYGGAQAHWRRGEKACSDCLAANAAYGAQWRRANRDKYRRELVKNQARDRAAWRLTARYPDEFRALCQDEYQKAGVA